MTRALHVGYLIQDFPPEVGAGPARVTELSARWQEQGTRVTVITAMPSRRIPERQSGTIDPAYRGKWFLEERWQGIRVLRSWVRATDSVGLGSKLINNVTFMLSGFVHAVSRCGRLDVLIASSPPFPALLAGALLAAVRRIPLVVELRDLWPDYLVGMGILQGRGSSKALFALERRLLRQASLVVVVTDSFKERVAKKGVPRERIEVIPNGVDLTRYRSCSMSDARAALADRLPPGVDFLVGYLGTFGRGQYLRQVLEAAELLSQRDSGIHILLVGDGPERDSIAGFIAERRLPNVSIWLPIAREQTPDFYNACNLCLVPLAPVPIFQETVPSKIYEIMACERPVIASVQGEAAAIVEESGGGLRVDPGDSRGLADAIAILRGRSPAEARIMGQRGRAYVAVRFDRTALADRYLQLLRSV